MTDQSGNDEDHSLAGVFDGGWLRAAHLYSVVVLFMFDDPL